MHSPGVRFSVALPIRSKHLPGRNTLIGRKAYGCSWAFFICKFLTNMTGRPRTRARAYKRIGAEIDAELADKIINIEIEGLPTLRSKIEKGIELVLALK